MTILLLVYLQHHTKPLRVILVLHRPAALELEPAQYGARGQFYIPLFGPQTHSQGVLAQKMSMNPSQQLEGPYNGSQSLLAAFIQ